MDEQVKYTMEDQKRSQIFMRRFLWPYKPVNFDDELAELIASVRAEAQQRLTDAQGEVKRLRARFGAVDGRLAAAEKLYETWKTEDTVAMMNLLEHSSVREKGAEMKALTLWQPWASLIYDGRKTIETRHWEMLYRGPLAIHAGMHVYKDACDDFGYDWRTIPRGAILCIVDVKDCVRFPHPLAPPDEYGDFESGRYGILMAMLEKFATPIPAKGHQGIWNWRHDDRSEGK